MPRRLLVVEDEAPVQELLAEYLRGRGFEVDVCDDGAAARAALVGGRYELLITDLKLPDVEGLELVREAWALDPQLPSLVMSGYASVESAVTAMTTGAVDVLLKPFRLREAHAAIERALSGVDRQRRVAFRLALADWFERLALSRTPEAAAERRDELLALVRVHAPALAVEVAPGPAGEGWAPLGPDARVRWQGADPGPAAWFAALHEALCR